MDKLKKVVDTAKSKLNDKLITAKYGKQLETLKPLLLKHIENKYKDEQKKEHSDFEISIDSINKLLIGFVEKAVPDQNLRNDLILTIQGKNPKVVLNLRTGKSEKIMFNAGQNPDGKIEINSSIGENIGNEMIRTNLANITSHFHEIIHSQSEKFYTGKYIEPKEHMIGEIEAMFMETMLWGYINKNAEQIATQLQEEGSTITKTQILQFVKINEMEHDAGLTKDIYNITNANAPGIQNKSYKMRYLLGEIQSRLLYERLKTEGMSVMDEFTTYLRTNSHLSVNEAIEMLNGGECTDFNGLINKFAEHIENQNNNTTESSSSSANESSSNSTNEAD